MKIKKTIYIILTIILGIFLSFLIHGLIEMAYIDYLIKNNIEPQIKYFFGRAQCFLPHYLQYGLLILGVVGGYFLGQRWWQIVYVEKRHWRMKKNLKLLASLACRSGKTKD